MRNADGYTRYDPVRTCRSLANWCARGGEYVSGMRSTAALSDDRSRELEQWLGKLRLLEQKAKSMLNTYPPSIPPAAVNSLLQEAYLLNEGFSHFPDAHPSGHGSSQGAPIAPNPVPIGGHALPPLPYDYDALEPYIDERTMRLHHDKHHQAYVDGLNRAEKKMEEARRTGDYDLILHWEREAAFHGAGHYLHTIFWNNMSPKGGGEPSVGGGLRGRIDADFGGFDEFKAHFSAAAEKAEGVGWAILVWSPRSHRLEILQAEKHQNLSQWDVVPLLVLDVWEHAYYLKYHNDRKTYIEAWWNVVNWKDVERRYDQARQLRWKPY
ncbi:superoxide dismutase [Paenibacillus sp.]|uniref:superoxide dismutase n=1 Tax=Paenibacillus sp. TaxID=58172 RepID=UPI0028110BBC|nr:superoxide dismutase [Paenibacillus sp.]